MKKVLTSLTMMFLLGVTVAMAAIPGTSGAPRMPKGSTNYITTNTKTTLNNAQWKDGYILPTIEGAATALSKTIFDVSGLTKNDEYVISFYSRIPEGLGNWNGGVGVTIAKSGKVEWSIHFQEKIAVLLNEEGLDMDIYDAPVPTESYVKFDIHIKPSPTMPDKTWAKFYINGVAIVSGRSKLDYVEFDTADAYFAFYKSNWAIPGDIQGIRVFKPDANASDYETSYVPKEPMATTPNSSTNTPQSTNSTIQSSQGSTQSQNNSTVKEQTSKDTEMPSDTQSGTENQESYTTGEKSKTVTSVVPIDKSSGSSKWIIFVIIAVVILAGGGIATFFIIKKVK